MQKSRKAKSITNYELRITDPKKGERRKAKVEMIADCGYNHPALRAPLLCQEGSFCGIKI
jgi:hypothetical protein